MLLNTNAVTGHLLSKEPNKFRQLPLDNVLDGCTRAHFFAILYMGQFPQDGENEQIVAFFFKLGNFSVTKRFDFFKFFQLF